MKRRTFLQTAVLSAGALSFLRASSKKHISMSKVDIHKFKVGNFQCAVIRDQLWNYLAQDYFTNANPELLQEELRKQGIDPLRISSPFIAFLLQDESRNILIDTGAGQLETPLKFRGEDVFLNGRLLALLPEVGLKPEDITHVILSHLHIDHIGGNFSSEGTLNFPNAEFIIHQKEWDFWHSSKAGSQPGIFQQFVANHATPLKQENLKLIQGDFIEILPGVQIVEAPGHTPGQLALVIGSDTTGHSPLLYLSDAFLHPLHIDHLNWETNYDLDRAVALKTRQKLLSLATESNMLVHGFHFDFPGLGRVEKLKSGFRWNYIQTQ